MSQPEISPKKHLSYSSDFLLKYQHIYKPDPEIETLLKPFIVQSSDNQSTLLYRSQGSPYAKFDASARFKSVPKTSPVPRRKLNEGQGNNNLNNNSKYYEKKSGLPNGPIYKPRQVQNDLSTSQKENIDQQQQQQQDLSQNSDLTEPQNQDLMNSQKLESSSSPTQSRLNHCNPYFSQSTQALRGSSSAEREIGKINPVYFYDPKFRSIFATERITGNNNNTKSEITNFENCVIIPSSDIEKFFNFIENPLSPIIPLVSDNSVTQPPQLQPTNVVNVNVTTTETKPLHDQNPEPWSSRPTDSTTLVYYSPTKNRSPNPKKNNQITPTKKSPNFFQTSPNKSPYRNQAVSPSGRPISPLDEQRLLQRQKQIDYGYRTVGYLRYRLLVPKEKRKPDHPRTPKKRQGCSKRSWDGQLKKWRRDLHLWDPDNIDAFKALLNSPIVETIVAANPELDDIVKTVREKLENPNSLLDDESDSEEGTPTSPISPDTHVMKGKSEVKMIESSKKTDSRVARTLVF